MPRSIGFPIWHLVCWKKGTWSGLQSWPALESGMPALELRPFFHQTQGQSETQKEQGIDGFLLNPLIKYSFIF